MHALRAVIWRNLRWVTRLSHPPRHILEARREFNFMILFNRFWEPFQILGTSFSGFFAYEILGTVPNFLGTVPKKKLGTPFSDPENGGVGTEGVWLG
jgi:hypothetical protein